MLENFLPIPDAPNYEINSQLICRNRRTKQILTLQVVPNRRTYYSLRVQGQKHPLKRSPKTLRAQAVEAANPKPFFEPIHSLGGKYEINPRGVVRNVRTKKIVKKNFRGTGINLYFAGKYIVRNIADLLWEAHGIISKQRFRPQPCSAEHSQGKFFFPNMNACARFLAPKLFFCVSRVAHKLNKRVPVIGEWKITYITNDLSDAEWKKEDINELNSEARYHSKRDKVVIA